MSTDKKWETEDDSMSMASIKKEREAESPFFTKRQSSLGNSPDKGGKVPQDAQGDLHICGESIQGQDLLMHPTDADSVEWRIWEKEVDEYEK
eukprot:12475522-Ditylum_brightwellii.AAC.1